MPIKTLADIFRVELDYLILQCECKSKELRIARKILGNNTVEGLTLPDFKMDNKASMSEKNVRQRESRDRPIMFNY